MITVNDPGETLTAAQTQILTAKAAAYPFDLHVFIATGRLTRDVFEAQVDAAVTPGSRIVSIGIDPMHHYSHAHFSAALGIPPGPAAAAAGNPFFKHGGLVEGIDAIASKANDLQAQTRAVTSQTGTPIVIHEHHTSAGVWGAFGVFAACALGAVAWWFWRARKLKQREAELAAEAQELRARNLEEAEWHDAMAEKRSSRPGVAVFPPGSTSPPAHTDYERMAERTRRSIPPSYAPSAPAVSYQPIPNYVVTPPTPIIINNGPSTLDLLLATELEREIERDSYRAPHVEPVVVERESSSSPSFIESPSNSDSTSTAFWDSNNDTSSSVSVDVPDSMPDTSSSSDFGSDS